MGDNPAKPAFVNLDFHDSILSRLKHWSENSVPKSDHKMLLNKYEKIKSFEAPIINKAMESWLLLTAKKRDGFRKETQDAIGAALTVIGSITSTFLIEKESIDPNDIFEKLFDASKILSDAFYKHSVSRKATITPAFNKTTRNILEKKKAEEFLFGNDLIQKIKESKAMANQERGQLLVIQAVHSTSRIASVSDKARSPTPSRGDKLQEPTINRIRKSRIRTNRNKIFSSSR